MTPHLKKRFIPRRRVRVFLRISLTHSGQVHDILGGSVRVFLKAFSFLQFCSRLLSFSWTRFALQAGLNIQWLIHILMVVSLSDASHNGPIIMKIIIIIITWPQWKQSPGQFPLNAETNVSPFALELPLNFSFLTEYNDDEDDIWCFHFLFFVANF